MKTTTLRLLLFVICLLCIHTSGAKPLNVKEVPEPLKPWIDWVSKGNEHIRCPFLYSGFERFQCAWPGELSLVLGPSGGEFQQQWQVYEESWLLLPGEAQYWPVDVTINGEPALVTARNGVPAIQTAAGNYTIHGRFQWNSLPKSLALPKSTALTAVTLEGKPVEFPRLEHDRLWLQVAQQQKVEDRFDLQVFRRIDDTIPARVTFYLDMQVAGNAREIALDLPLTEDFIPLSLTSPLPARLDSDHTLRLQIKPGRWAVELTVRHLGPLHDLTLHKPDGNWVTQEVWVFDAHPQYRIVNVSGVTAIDPQQTLLPDAWKQLPAYLVKPDQTMTFEEERRGDPDPGADNLSLHRNVWLSFSGDQYTIQDTISGVKKTAWRLETNPPITLGQVTIDGKPQYITRLQDSERTGVEVRQGNIHLTADSVQHGRVDTLPATGWNQQFNSVSATLHIPPGYKVLAITGADRVSATWLSRWTLLDIFLVLLISAAVGKLWGRGLGAITLITLILIYHEANAPVWIWLFVVLGFAVLRVLPTGRLRQWALVYRNITLIALLLIIVPFFIHQIRISLYPQLENYYRAAVPTGTTFTAGERAQAPAPRMKPAPMPGIVQEDELPDLERFSVPSLAPKSELAKKSKLQTFDPNAQLQTGPGLPQWQWNRADFSWSGPVGAQQQVHITYVGPLINSLLGWVRVILVCIVFLGILNVRLSKNAKIRMPSLQSFTSLMLLSLLGILAATNPTPASAEFPSKALLEELQQRLFAPPDCLPRCAEAESMNIDLAPDTLTLNLTINSRQLVAIPIPGGAEHWTPQRIWINDQPARILSKDPSGTLWIPVTKGRHRVRLEGMLAAVDTVQLPLPLKPHSVSLTAEGWDVAGVHGDGSVDTQLQFTRLSRQLSSSQQGADNITEFNTNNLPPLVQIERNILLGLDWRVQTTVTRLSPAGTAIVLKVPLLSGESVTTEGTRVENGNVLINMGANQASAGWRSVLDITDELQLTAADTTQWTEVWNLDISPIWHMQYQGIPVIRHQRADHWLPQWRPWPGEQVTFHLFRPQGVQGQTTTIDYSRLNVNPGIRITNALLQLHLRSSQGAQHLILLPENSTLQEVKIDSAPVPIRLQGRTLTLPVKPGEQTYHISWQEPRGMNSRFNTSTVDIGNNNVNHHIVLSVPRDRVVLLVGGPSMGPAVLFWGVIIVFLLLCIGLAKFSNLIPLRYWQWTLLSIGLVPISIESALLVIGWFFITGYRRRLTADSGKWKFNVYQLLLIGFTLVTAGTLVYAVSQGLLGSPDMQIFGNGSSQYQLNWYQDRNSALLPQAWMLTIPMFAYRILMLLWALWLAFSVVAWSKWFWQCFSTHGYWRSVDWKGKLESGPKDKSLPTASGRDSSDAKYLADNTPKDKPGDEPSH